MSSIKLFEKPLGMRDTFPQIYEKLESMGIEEGNIVKILDFEFEFK